MAKPKRMNVLSFALFQAIIIGIVGLLAGILYSFGGFLIDLFVTVGWVTSAETPGLSYGTVLAFGALIGMPLIFAIFGFIFGLVEAILYNLFSKWIHKIEINFER